MQTNSLPSQPKIDPIALRRCLGSFVTGVTVVTALDLDGNSAGLTVNSFTSVSLDPPLVLWSLRLQSKMHPIFSSAERFIVNILSERQIEVSQRFGSPSGNRFEGLKVERGIGGVPRIVDCAANVECRRVAAYPGGDHVIFLGEVERIHHSDRNSLAFRGGEYMVVHSFELGAWAAAPEMSGLAQVEALKMARNVAEELSLSTGKSIGIAVWGNRGPTMVWWAEGRQPLQVALRAGLVMPVLRSASGHLFLAFKAETATQPFVELEVGGPPGERLAELRAQVRAERLAQVRGNILPDVNTKSISAFSAPVFDRQGDIVLALTMMDHTDDLAFGDGALLRLKEAAADLSTRLGHRDTDGFAA